MEGQLWKRMLTTNSQQQVSNVPFETTGQKDKKNEGRLTVFFTSSAVRHGTVLFSTIIAPSFACRATSRVTASKAVMSVAYPLPAPRLLVGVLTAMSTTSASEIHPETSVLNIKFGVRAATFVILLPSPHWLLYSELEVESSSTSPSRESAGLAVGRFEKEISRDPSRATRTISPRPGS